MRCILERKKPVDFCLRLKAEAGEKMEWVLSLKENSKAIFIINKEQVEEEV